MIFLQRMGMGELEGDKSRATEGSESDGLTQEW